MAIKVPILSSLDDKGFRDADRALKRLQDAGGATGAWAGATRAADAAIQPLNRSLLAVAGATALGVRAASDQEQAFGALTAVYGKSAAGMEKWSREQSKIGLSAADAANQATRLGAQLTGAGASAADAATQSQKLVGLGGDLSATFGGSTADAVSALGAAFRGEFDPLDKFGVTIKQADVNARLAAQSQGHLTGEARRSAEAAAIQAMIWEQTAAAQGQAGREAGSAAGSTAAAAAALTNAGADITTSLLPAVAAAAGKVADLAQIMGQHPGVVAGVVAALVLLRGAIALNAAAMAIYTNRVLIMSGVEKIAAAGRAILTGVEVAARVGYAALQVVVGDTIKKIVIWAASQASSAAATVAATVAAIAQRVALVAASAAMKLVTAAQWALNLAMSANPVGLLVALIIGLIAVIVILWQKNEGFRNAVTAIWRGISDGFRSAIDGIRRFIDGLIDKITALWDKFKAIKDKISSGLGGLGNAIGLSAAPAVTPITATNSSPTQAPAVTRAVDVMVTDEQLARAVARLLLRSQVRSGRALQVG